MKQGTPEWFKERAGHLSSSTMDQAMSKPKSKAPGAISLTKLSLMTRLVAERLTGEPQETYTNDNMERGKEVEPFARMSYESARGVMVQEVGFVKDPEVEWLGVSPDGLVDDDGLVELKCPMSHTHMKYIHGGEAPKDYWPQMTLQLIVTRRKWVDFVSYDPRFPDNLRLFVVRFIPTAEYIKEVTEAAHLFLVEAGAMEAKWRKMEASALIKS